MSSKDNQNLIDIFIANLKGLPSVLSLYYLALAFVGYYLFSKSTNGNTDIAIGFVLIVAFVGGASLYYISNLNKEIALLSKENASLKVQNVELNNRVDELENKLDKVIKFLPEKTKKYVVL